MKSSRYRPASWVCFVFQDGRRVSQGVARLGASDADPKPLTGSDDPREEHGRLLEIRIALVRRFRNSRETIGVGSLAGPMDLFRYSRDSRAGSSIGVRAE